jgi:hypothetical protein
MTSETLRFVYREEAFQVATHLLATVPSLLRLREIVVEDDVG